MSEKSLSIIIAGVGGQGVIKASDLLAHAAFNHGLDVKKAEVHGLAQRGGSLLIQVRLGERVLSPLINPGSADFLVGFEKLEAYRYFNWLKQDGFLLYDDLEIVPVGNSRHDYPADLDSFFSSQTCRTAKTSAMAEAIRQGDASMQSV
ncbi:MAG: 2-oxoacid:acceptor oxidoreductase family protein, partial [Candidatus Wallbacteria bacterium]|nr:2-oxoacid:acceptor oxidoreductase family protein [Candidatus Wallbacteria bacterium]